MSEQLSFDEFFSRLKASEGLLHQNFIDVLYSREGSIHAIEDEDGSWIDIGYVTTQIADTDFKEHVLQIHGKTYIYGHYYSSYGGIDYDVDDDSFYEAVPEQKTVWVSK